MGTLSDKITDYFPNYRRSGIKNLFLLVLCLLDGGTVNLYKLRGRVGKHTPKPISAGSGYKRLVRLFDSYAHSRLWLDLLLFGFRLLRLESKYLVLDGTSWKRHGVKRHYLTLSLVYRSVAIPIYWVDLAKLGISSTKERKRMFRRVFKHFDLKGKLLLADREYIGTEWFKYLTDNGLEMTIRLREKNYRQQIDQSQGKSYQAMLGKVLQSRLAYKVVGKRVEIEGRTYTFVVAKYLDHSGKPCLLLLLSSLLEAPARIAAGYLNRWKIECCFRHLKSNGFDLEQINLNGQARSRLLMAVVVFAYVLSIHEGLKTYKKVRTALRKDGERHKAESVFRHGYDTLIAKIDSTSKMYQYICSQIHLAMTAYRSAKWAFV
jgi:hypothetical protein